MASIWPVTTPAPFAVLPPAQQEGEEEVPFSIPLAAAIFMTIWFVVLFVVLPFGIRSQVEAGDMPLGADPGAPIAPKLLAKFAWTTLISAGVFAAVAALAKYAD